MSSLSIRNMNRTMDEMEAIREAGQKPLLEPVYYWRVLTKDKRRCVRDMHMTKAEIADTWKRLYQNGKFILRCTKMT